ncbi:MAG: hypothetical protein KC646_07780 [Candidatus Cloacimonetes bacterium]|nr:hypothetical protein [Candidatus Cloacimonadota bacterium]
MNKNILSLISLICAFICFVLGFCSLFILDTHDTFPIKLLYLFLSFLAFTLVLEYKKIVTIFSKSYHWFGLSHFYRSIGILSLVSLLATASYQSKHFIDWTENKTFSVHPDTHLFLKKFPIEITLIASSSKHQNFYNPLDTFLKNIQSQNMDITVKKIDPIQFPSFLDKHNIKSTPCVIISYKGFRQILKRYHFFVNTGGLQNKLKFTGESALLQAVIRLKESQKLNILYPQHSKISFLDDSPHGLSYLKTLLINDGFDVSINIEENLLTKDPLLVILDNKALSSDMEEKLITRANQSLPTIIYLDALPQNPIKQFCETFKLQVPGYIVLDPVKRVKDDLSLVSTTYSKHSINRGLHPKNNPVILLSATAFLGQDRYKKIISSSNFSWMESTLNPSIMPQYNQDKDFKGPLDYGLEINPKTLIFSDTDFLKNQFLQLSGNQTLLLNSIHFILGNSSYLTSRGKDLQTPRVKINKQDIRSFTIFILFLLPLLCLCICATLQFIQYRS